MAKPKDEDKSFFRPDNELAEAICELREFMVANLSAVTKRDLERELNKTEDRLLKAILETKGNIMSVISDFAAKQSAYNARQEKAIDGLVADFKTLADLIEKLQNSPGGITPEDQAFLNDAESRADAITLKLEALDAQTPPVVPGGSGDGAPVP